MADGRERPILASAGLSGMGREFALRNADMLFTVMRRMSEAGVTALAVGLPNYLKELPYFRAEVLPRLERSGLRTSRLPSGD